MGDKIQTPYSKGQTQPPSAEKVQKAKGPNARVFRVLRLSPIYLAFGVWHF
jgi:hypothetical protein